MSKDALFSVMKMAFTKSNETLHAQETPTDMAVVITLGSLCCHNSLNEGDDGNDGKLIFAPERLSGAFERCILAVRLSGPWP